MIDIRLTGINSAINGLKAYELRKRGRVENVLNITAINLQSRIKRNITEQKAVDTGRYRSSVNIDVMGTLSREIGPHVAYDQFIEFGTKNMPARPSTFPAWEAEKPIYISAMAGALK